MKILNLLFVLVTIAVFSGCGDAPVIPKGSVKVESRPSGATIYLGGKKIGVTPKKFSGPDGKYRIKLEKLGYKTRWVDFKLKSGKAINIHEDMPENGSNLLVESNPKNANVTLNGKKMGITPMVITNLMPGKYEILLEKMGYAEQTIPLQITHNRPEAIRVNIISNLGEVNIDSVPTEARIYINNKPHGVTPFKGKIEAGEHQVRLEKAGTIPLETSFKIDRNGYFKKRYTLATSPGSIKIETNPVAVSVYLNDKLAGVSPITLADVPSGVQKIKLEKLGFDTVTQDVDVAPDCQSSVDVTMQTSTGELHLSVIPAGVAVYFNSESLGLVKQTPGGSVDRTEMIRKENLKPGKYRVVIAHKRAIPERKEFIIEVKKGKVTRPLPIVMWVPNAEIKWRDTGFVEVGMLYGEGARHIYFGAEPGIKVKYDRSKITYIKKLDINE